MIYYKTQTEIDKLKAAGTVVHDTLVMLEDYIKPGVELKKLDELAEEFILSKNALPGFKGYNGFPATLCLSVNEEVVHGIPNGRQLVEGDILSIDCGTILNGYWGDHARTFSIGEISEENKLLLKTTKESLFEGIKNAIPGNHLSDIGHAVQKKAESMGFSVVRSLVGHGVGKNLHEEPQVPNYGRKGRGLKLKPGLVIAIEPMINVGTHEVFTDKDAWTVITKDRKTSAHFEHTIAITETGNLILTDGK